MRGLGWKLFLEFGEAPEGKQIKSLKSNFIYLLQTISFLFSLSVDDTSVIL